MTKTSGLESVTVVIPALNEEQALPLVLRDLPPVGRVIVVDNGSQDGTAEVAAEAGATVVREPQRGYGAACLAGLAAIRQAIDGGEPAPRVVVFVDGDHSDHPELLPQLVDPLLRGEADFVLGSRILGPRERGAMPAQSVFGNHLACFLMRVFFRSKYTDLGPFRAMDYDRLCALEMDDRNFGWTIEMQIKAVRAGLRIRELPVPYRVRVGRSKISGTLLGSIKAGGKILYTIAKYGVTPFAILAVLALVSCGCYAALTALSSRFAHEVPFADRPIPRALGLLAIAFVAYAAAIAAAGRAGGRRSVFRLIVGAAVVFRLVLLPSTPIQEIDIYRYAWDGMVLSQGISPFRYSPQQVRDASPWQPFDRELARLVQVRKSDPAVQAILERIHYSELPTVYPPVSQVVFAAAAVMTPFEASIEQRLLILKICFVAFDLATLWLVIQLLRLARRPASWCVVYGWCPLVIKEFGNSGHLDSVAVCLTTLAIYLAARWWLRTAGGLRAPNASRGGGFGTMLLLTSAAFVLALAVGAKLYPVVLVPLFAIGVIRRSGWRSVAVPGLVFVATAAALVWPMTPWAARRAALPAAAVTSPSGTPAANPDPSRGLATFFRRWEMNDFLFQIVMENLRPVSTIPPGQGAWCAVVSPTLRDRLVAPVADRYTGDPWEAAFLIARVITLTVFLGLALWFAWRATQQSDLPSWLLYVFLTIAWFWLLSPTQNPWYWIWAMPLLVFARSRVWLALSGLLLLYYLRFWFIYQYPSTPVLSFLPYHGTAFFDVCMTWVEYAPWFFCLSLSSELARLRSKGRAGEGAG